MRRDARAAGIVLPGVPGALSAIDPNACYRDEQVDEIMRTDSTCTRCALADEDAAPVPDVDPLRVAEPVALVPVLDVPVLDVPVLDVPVEP